MFTRPIRQITAPLRRLTSRPLPTGTQQFLRTRFSSTQAPGDPGPQGSRHQATFYKTFGRPIAKVFLMAIFTYQLAYFFWVKLEQDETRAEMQATISELEARIETIEKAKERKKR